MQTSQYYRSIHKHACICTYVRTYMILLYIVGLIYGLYALKLVGSSDSKLQETRGRQTEQGGMSRSTWILGFKDLMWVSSTLRQHIARVPAFDVGSHNLGLCSCLFGFPCVMLFLLPFFRRASHETRHPDLSGSGRNESEQPIQQGCFTIGAKRTASTSTTREANPETPPTFYCSLAS